MQWRSRTEFYNECRPVVPGGAGGVPSTPDFGRSVNPISTKGDRLCPPNNTGTPGFSYLPTALQRKPASSFHFAETKIILIIRRLVGSSGSIYNLHLRAQVCFAIIRGMQNKHHHIMYDVAMSHLSTRGVSWYLPMHVCTYVFKLTYLIIW